MSVRRLKAMEAEAALNAGKQAEHDRRVEINQRLLSAIDAEDSCFLAGQSFWRRLFLQRNARKVALFSKQVIIKAHERGLISGVQAQALAKSVDLRLRGEGSG